MIPCGIVLFQLCKALSQSRCGPHPSFCLAVHPKHAGYGYDGYDFLLAVKRANLSRERQKLRGTETLSWLYSDNVFFAL